MSNNNLRNNKLPRTTLQQRNRRLQIHQRIARDSGNDAAGASSPEPASESRQDDDLANADISTLQKMEKEHVREWHPMKQGFPMPASNYLASESALNE